MANIPVKGQDLKTLIKIKKFPKQPSLFQGHHLLCSHQDRVPVLPFLSPSIAMSCLLPRGVKLKINALLMPFSFSIKLPNQEGRDREQQIAQYFVEVVGHLILQ